MGEEHAAGVDAGGAQLPPLAPAPNEPAPSTEALLGQPSRAALERERAARKQAEQLLEEKSRELFAAHSELARWNRELERRVEERTAALEQALREADAANRAKAEFLRRMTHELRTPLHPMLGLTSLLLEGPLSPELREPLTVVHRSATHLRGLIDKLLEVDPHEVDERPQPSEATPSRTALVCVRNPVLNKLVNSACGIAGVIALQGASSPEQLATVRCWISSSLATDTGPLSPPSGVATDSLGICLSHDGGLELLDSPRRGWQRVADTWQVDDLVRLLRGGP